MLVIQNMENRCFEGTILWKLFRIFDDRAHRMIRATIAPLLHCSYKRWRLCPVCSLPNNSLHLFTTASLCTFGSETSLSFIQHSFILYIL
jgi:hypothetical protein